MGSEDHQGLSLGLGFQSSSSPKSKPVKQPPAAVYDYELPSLTLSLSGVDHQHQRVFAAKKVEDQPCSAAVSASSSLSNAATAANVKRERETASSEDEEEDGSGPTTNTRKKLRLTKDQSNLLEESFKLQSTLNLKQKQELADRLNLRPRQVEVWFQNRRARTKLKQTEVDCEYLKKWCETLTDENKRLQKEVEELKAFKLAAQPSLYMHLPAATLSMCPSCERVAGAGVPVIGATTTTSKSRPFTMGPTKSHFYSAFTNSSAAC